MHAGPLTDSSSQLAGTTYTSTHRLAKLAVCAMQSCRLSNAAATAPQQLPPRRIVATGCLMCAANGLLGSHVQPHPIQVLDTCSSSSSSSSSGNNSSHAATSIGSRWSYGGSLPLVTPQAVGAASSNGGARCLACSSSRSRTKDGARGAYQVTASSTNSSSSSSSSGQLPDGKPPPSTEQGLLPEGSQQQPSLVDNTTVVASVDSTNTTVGTTSSSGSSSSNSSESGGADESESLPVRAALAMLNFYRSSLSPLMQSTCRFLPTCSQYSINSYKAYGVWKGTVLTAWRLMRCNPWGDSGYDPTTWPPPKLGWLFRYDYTAELAVVVGTAAFLRLGHAVLFE